jgi:benzoyl-CoA reductase/2-hydroxyglutaryl-CoA dehydratase subunit BcrC/BadD/HgdB
MKHEKTFNAISKLKDIEMELHRLKNALEMANRALDAQRTWVGLTDEEILAVNMSTVTKLIDDPIVCDTDHNIIQLGKAIEAKLKQKNTRGQE